MRLFSKEFYGQSKVSWVILLVLSMLILWLSEGTLYSFQYGAVFGAIGLALKLVEKSSSRVQLYRYLRFPVVLSNFLILLSISVASRNVYVLVCSLFVIGYFASRWCQVQDKKFLGVLGDRYALYMASVPQFFPRIPGSNDQEVVSYLTQKRKGLELNGSGNIMSFDFPRVGPQALIWFLVMLSLFLKIKLVS